MHLRAPSIDRGTSAFAWTLVFFAFMFVGGVLIGIGGAEALVVSAVVSFFIFLFIRLRGTGPGERGE